MRVGTIAHGGSRYQVHVHVLAADSPEVRQLLWFRDRLRSDATLRAAYVIRKRAILDQGVTDSLDYCEAKGGFI